MIDDERIIFLRARPRNPLLAAALEYAEKGWHVFPLASGAKLPFSTEHGETCVAPHGHGHLDATTDELIVRAWWREHPFANVGIATGAKSGIVVIDIDPKHGGNESFARLECEIGAFPKTLAVRTPSGGRHFYFKHPGGHVKSTSGVLAPGIDVRGDGGFVVAPPSRIKAGNYECLS
jgi:putative DNA primase/helicase